MRLYLFAPSQVSTIYNKAIATSNTDIIVNSVVVLFVMDLDEWIFAALKACNEKWTKHAADSEDSSSDTKAEKGGVVDEMQDKIALQDAQIADQQKELRLLRSQQEELVLQMDEMKRQSDDITILREAVKQLQESQAATSASSESFPIPQCDANGSVTAPTAESVDTSSDKVVGNGGTMSEVGDENALQKGQIIQTQREEIIIPCDVEQKIEDSQVAAATLL